MNDPVKSAAHPPQAWRSTAALLLFFACLAAAILSARGVLVERFFHDIYTPIDVIWRSALGQTPHIDYHTPVGQAFTWPYQVALLFQESGPLVILSGNLVVGSVLLLLGLLTLRSRLRPLLLFVAVAGLVVTAMSPRDHDSMWYVYSHLAPYTRWGFALSMLAALIALLPRCAERNSPAADIVDGLVLGALTAFLYYLKLNFCMAAIGFIGLGVLLRSLSVRAALLAGLTAAALALVVELVAGNNAAYLADLSAAAQANGNGILVRLFGRDSLQSAFLGAVEITAGLALLRIADPNGNWRDFVGRWWRELALFVGMVGIVVVTHTQNNFTREIPPLSTAFLLLVELRLRRGPLLEAEGTGRWRRPVALALVGIWGVGLHLLDSAAIVSHSVATHEADAQSIPALRGTAGERLLVSQQLMEEFPGRPELSQPQDPAAIPPNSLLERRRRWRALTAMEARSIGEAATMLKPHAGGRPRVLSIDFGNPFPAFFRLPPPTGSLLWWDPGRSFSATSHPDFAVLLNSTDIVMHKRADTFAGIHAVALWSVIGPEVERRFQAQARGPLWTLLAR